MIYRLRPHIIPPRLIYSIGSTSRIFSTKTGNILGEIQTEKIKLQDNSFYPNGKGLDSLYIRNLEVNPFARRQGVGTELVNFVKNLSKKTSAEGRVHLVAYNASRPSNAPHKFYRKQGFVATSPIENKLIDFAIEENIPIPPLLTQGTAMYLPQ